MSIPKKLKSCKKTNSFILDENENDVLLVYSTHIDSNNNFRNELTKRYNDYNLLKVYVIGLSLAVITLTIALCTKEII